jgi:hypothetical protein
MLQTRLDSLRKELEAIQIVNFSTKPFQGLAAAGGILSSSGDISALIQTLGSMTAVNETLMSAPGTPSDNTLIAMVGGQLTANTITLPSQMPPQILNTSTLEGTYLWGAIQALETSRQSALEDSLKYSQAVVDAKLVLAADPTKPPYTDQDRRTAGVLAENSSQIQAINTLIVSASAAADAFESTLLTGQAPSQPNSGNQGGNSPNSNSNQVSLLPNLPGSGGPAPAPVKANGGANPPGANPPPANLPAANPPAANLPTPNPTSSNVSQQGQPTPQAAPTGSAITLQQLLYADLLLHSISPADQRKQALLFLSLHALESGGSQLSKSNLFLGSRIYFSGGAVASFTLYSSESSVLCSGIGYGFKGYIREKDVEHVIRDDKGSASVLTTC